MAGGTVHGPPYQECQFLTRWFFEYQPWITARAALAGRDWRDADAGWLIDLTFGLFIEMALTEKGDKRLEFIKRVTTQIRGEAPTAPGQEAPHDPTLPKNVGAPVN
jgi:hypothetical protein